MLIDMPCNPTEDQILFVMVRKTASLPLFNMKFTNYGYNRRVWTEQLRYAGYEMKVFRDGFLVEVPHMKFVHAFNLTHSSPYLNSFIEKQNENGEEPNRPLFLQTLKELEKKYGKYEVCKKWCIIHCVCSNCKRPIRYLIIMVVCFHSSFSSCWVVANAAILQFCMDWRGINNPPVLHLVYVVSMMYKREKWLKYSTWLFMDFRKRI